MTLLSLYSEPDISLETANKLLRIIKDANFYSISSDRLEKIDKIVDKFKRSYIILNESMKISILFTSDKLIASYKTKFSLLDENELAYFFINVVDPELKLIELYNIANSKEELKELCFKECGLYPPLLIKIENRYSNYLEIQNNSLVEGR